MLEKKIKAHEIMYGVNTGIGEFSEVVLNDDQVKIFRNTLFIIMRQESVIRCRSNMSVAPCLAGSMCMPMEIREIDSKSPDPR